MEAVKKLPMISFELKTSPEATSFHNLKQCIAEYYAEDPDSYAKEFRELEELRGLATCRPRITNECCATIKRYYSQLHSLQNRFPLSSESELLNFSWKDIYSGSVWTTSNVKYEMASILYNIAAVHSKLGVDEERNDPESMKLACTHFQCAAWAFSEMKNQYGLLLKGDLSVELMIFMQQICFAQAQECILEKSLADNRKAAIIAKVTAQVISFYNAAMSALFSQNEDGSIQELIGNKLYKEWLKYIKFKISYLSSVLFLYQGQHSEEQRKMGERLALYNAACDKLEEAKKETKGMNKIEIITEAMVLATDIIEGKRKNAKQENEFIYHEAIPDLSAISAVQGANLVQGIPFEVTDPQVIGEDIFKRLVPMKAHENLSLYSEEKANILRRLGAKIDERDAELASFMGALNMDVLNSMKQSQEKLPQNLVDRCAELSAKPNAISDLVESMSSLANICADVEYSLNEIKRILDEESKLEAEFQKQMGKRPTGHMTELTREFTKYFDAHTKAGESNDTLRKAMELHVNNLKILAQPLAALKTQVPQSEPVDETVRRELETLLNKVEEMKTQRDAIYEELRDQILNKDDITPQLIANGDKDVDELFKKELKKYSQSVNIIEQNLVAQGNILKALTDTYAKHAMSLKAYNDAKNKRDQFYSGLIGSFDVYEDLMSKSAKGLDFYKKLHGNIQKLLSRVKAAKDVQEEERQQLLKKAVPKTPVEVPKPDMSYKNNAYNPNATNIGASMPPTTGMKLKDYIKSGMVPNIGSLREDKNQIPAVRPSPVGQENITAGNQASCPSTGYIPTSSSIINPQMYYQQQAPNLYTTPQYQQPSSQNRDQKIASSGNTSMSSSTTSLNQDYHVANQYGQVYANPMLQMQLGGQINPNQYYQDPNLYGNYGFPANYQNVAPTMNYPEYSNLQMNMQQNMGAVNQPQQYSATQQHLPDIKQSQSSFQQPQAIEQQNSYQPYAMNQTQIPEAPKISDNNQGFQQNLQFQNQQPTTDNNHAPAYQYSDTKQPAPVQTPQNMDNYANYYQQSTGEVIPNIYKNQLQYPTVKSPPVMQYPVVSTPGGQYSSPQNQYSQVPNQQEMASQNSTNSNFQQGAYSYGQPNTYQWNQYGQSNASDTYGQQNYSCYTPTVNSINSYMTSGNNFPEVTQSAGYATPPSQQHPVPDGNLQNVQPMQQTGQTMTTNTPSVAPNQNTQSQLTNTQSQQVTSPIETKKIKSENIDLLSGLDFSISQSNIDNIPTLTPISVSAKKDEKNIVPEVSKTPEKKIEVAQTPQSPVKINDDLAGLNFDSLNMTSVPKSIAPQPEKSKQVVEDPFEDATVLKQFHKEVESLEKYMETLTVKTLNGVTPLANKWKELQDLLVKDEASRSISVAKLFPDKNRFNDFLPYDHGRVLLPTATDNYINAVMVKNCGPVSFIMAQTPMENTLNDWWEMVWSQKSNVVVCLHSSTELLDSFWPQNVNDEKTYGEISVTLEKQFELSHCVEKKLKVMRNGSDKVAYVSLLQVKSWKKRSADHILDVSCNIITTYNYLNPNEKTYSPIILNCISGTERSGLITLGISAILATKMRKPILLNIVDHWFRICSQRKCVVEDESYLQFSLQIVLNNAHRILNKRGIMTSYQVKNVEKLNSPIETENVVKDSLQELDPFWKFK